MLDAPRVREARNPLDPERARGHRHVGGPIGAGPRERHWVIAAVAVAAVAAAASAVATYSASQSQAAANRYNAKVAENQAAAARAAAKVEADNRTERFKRVMASSRVALGASGVEASEGSPLLVQMDSATEAALDVARVRYTGELRSTAFQSEANLKKFEAKAATRAGYIGAGATLLSGASTAIGAYNTGQYRRSVTDG